MSENTTPVVEFEEGTTAWLAKKNYSRKLWTYEMLRTMVSRGKLTKEEFGLITGYDYDQE
mgnify:CR=1 FL=1